MTKGIYELPSRSARKYRGKYPERVWSVGHGGRGRAVHIELNNGRRFVALPSMLTGQPHCGMHISKVFKPIGIIPTMAVSDYAAIIFIHRLTLLVNPVRYRR